LSLVFSALCFGGTIKNGSCPTQLRPSPSLTVVPGVLRVGMQVNLSPINGFNFTDPVTGTLDGFDVRVACLFAACLGTSLQIVNLPFAGLIPAVQSGGIDIILGQQNRTEARLKLIEQVPYGGTAEFSLVFRTPHPAGLVTGTDLLVAINDLAGNKSIGVVAGTIQETILDDAIANRGLTNLRKVILADLNAGLSALSQGTILAFFVQGLGVSPTDTSFTQLVTSIPAAFIPGPVSAGIRKANCPLINAFANFVRLNVAQLQTLAEQFTPGFPFDPAALAFTPQECQLITMDPCIFANCPFAQAIANKFCPATGQCNFTVIDPTDQVAR
jgi:ABC-type amino acid transport substrate-binding protein